MKIWTPLVIVITHWATMCCAASDKGGSPRKGRLDFVGGVFDFSLKVNEGQVNLEVIREPEGSNRISLDVENSHSPFFEMTTQLSGVVRVENDISLGTGFTGRFESQNTRINGHSAPEVFWDFDLGQGVVHMRGFFFGRFKRVGESLAAFAKSGRFKEPFLRGGHCRSSQLSGSKVKQ